MKQLAALTAAAVAATGVYGLTRVLGNDQPRGVSQPIALAAPAVTGPNGLTGPAVCAVTFTVPGKQWNGVFHYSPTILKPTRLEKVCVTYPAAGGTLASVSVVPA